MERRYPDESPEYRKARDELLDAEDALREQVERVAAQRRELPLGGEVEENYVFVERDSTGSPSLRETRSIRRTWRCPARSRSSRPRRSPIHRTT